MVKIFYDISSTPRTIGYHSNSFKQLARFERNIEGYVDVIATLTYIFRSWTKKYGQLV